MTIVQICLSPDEEFECLTCMMSLMENLLSHARQASRDSKECRSTIDALRSMGFGDDAFSALHHQNGSATVFYAYCKSVHRFTNDGNNHCVHQRLTYVLLSCSGGVLPQGMSFKALAKESVKKLPLAS